MYNRAATIPNMTTGWYMSFPMFLYVLVFRLLNDKLRNCNTETSDNKAGERIVKICQCDGNYGKNKTWAALMLGKKPNQNTPPSSHLRIWTKDKMKH